MNHSFNLDSAAVALSYLIAMPYIKPELRQKIDKGETPNDAGELNYALTRLLLKYLKKHGTSYRVFNDILGAMQGAAFEFYRRWVAPYEDKKIEENGDVSSD